MYYWMPTGGVWLVVVVVVVVVVSFSLSKNAIGEHSFLANISFFVKNSVLSNRVHLIEQDPLKMGGGNSISEYI